MKNKGDKFWIFLCCVVLAVGISDALIWGWIVNNPIATIIWTLLIAIAVLFSNLFGYARCERKWRGEL